MPKGCSEYKDAKSPVAASRQTSDIGALRHFARPGPRPGRGKQGPRERCGQTGPYPREWRSAGPPNQPRSSQAQKSSGSRWVGLEPGRGVLERQLGLRRRTGGVKGRRLSANPMRPRRRVTSAAEVTAATIRIRPEHRAHASTSVRNTRQIREAHGNLPGAFGASAPAGVGRRSGSGVTVSSGRHNLGSRGESGSQHATVADQICPRARHDRDQPLDELMRRVPKRGRTDDVVTLHLEIDASLPKLSP